MKDKPELVWGGRDLRIEVAGDDGMLLFTVLMLAIDAHSLSDLQKGYAAKS